MKNKLILLTLLAFGTILNGCKEDPPEEPQDGGNEPGTYNLTLNMVHVFDGETIEMNTGNYIKTGDDTISFSKIRYHINNFHLVDQNGNHHHVDQNFIVEDGEEETKTLVLKDIPVGTYTSIGFDIGVKDSMANVEGSINNQFIDPMYWSMAMGGYINMKVEGKSKRAPNETYVLHIGGYVGNQKTAQSVDLATNIAIESGADLDRNIKVDFKQFFDGVNPIDLSQIHMIHSAGDKAVYCAENIPAMFSINNN